MTVKQVARAITRLEDEGGGGQVLNSDVIVDLHCSQPLIV